MIFTFSNQKFYNAVSGCRRTHTGACKPSHACADEERVYVRCMRTNATQPRACCAAPTFRAVGPSLDAISFAPEPLWRDAPE